MWGNEGSKSGRYYSRNIDIQLKYRQLTQVDIAVLMSPIVGDPGSPPYLFEMDSDPFHLCTMPGKKTAFEVFAITWQAGPQL